MPKKPETQKAVSDSPMSKLLGWGMAREAAKKLGTTQQMRECRANNGKWVDGKCVK